MANYRIHIRPSAVKELESLSRKDRRRLVSRIRRLGREARPIESEKLSVREKFRLRVGFCRVAYRVDDEASCVSIVKVGRRRDVLDRVSFLVE